ATQNTAVAQKLTQIAINLWSCLPLFLQKAGLASLGTDQKQAEQDLIDYREKADIVYEGLNDIQGVSCIKPTGAFYALPNVTGACRKLGLAGGEELRKYLLTYDKENKKGVAVLARIHFGSKRPDEQEEYIRIAYPGTKESVIEGIKRLKDAIEA
ncbi:MAG TPA: pyridoxal phosphate-dependent aminotransferase, partial [bacterium]|nr:pyridoxal phosphate-dependent aminotransferase [bacterium]